MKNVVMNLPIAVTFFSEQADVIIHASKIATIDRYCIYECSAEPLLMLCLSCLLEGEKQYGMMHLIMQRLVKSIGM